MRYSYQDETSAVTLIRILSVSLSFTPCSISSLPTGIHLSSSKNQRRSRWNIMGCWAVLFLSDTAEKKSKRMLVSSVYTQMIPTSQFLFIQFAHYLRFHNWLKQGRYWNTGKRQKWRCKRQIFELLKIKNVKATAVTTRVLPKAEHKRTRGNKHDALYFWIQANVIMLIMLCARRRGTPSMQSIAHKTRSKIWK